MKILSLAHGFTKEFNELNGLGAAPKFGFTYMEKCVYGPHRLNWSKFYLNVHYLA